MSFLDNLFKGAPANALATPIGAIDVSASTPVIDALLKVTSTSPLQASWVPGGGGGGGGGAPTWTTSIITAGTLTPDIDNYYACFAPCVVTLPDATVDGMDGHSIALLFFSGGPNTVNAMVGEGSNIIISGPNTVASIDGPGGTVVLLTAVYKPEVYPVGIWVAQFYALPSFSTTQQLHTSEIFAVYPDAELPTPYDNITIDGVTTISGNGSTVGNLAHDFQGSYAEGQLVLMMFLDTDAGLYRCVRDNGGTDWAFTLVESPTTGNDPAGDPTYYVQVGETWGQRTVQLNQNNEAFPFYTFRRAPLDYYPQNGDVLGTGSNSGNVHSNTNQVLPGRVNLYQTSGFHSYTLAAPDANQEHLFGERFAIKCVNFTGGPVTFNLDVTPATIEDPAGLISSAISFTMQLGTYIEWQLMPDNVWHLVSWWPGNTGG